MRLTPLTAGWVGVIAVLAAYLLPISPATVSVLYPIVHFAAFLGLAAYLFRLWPSHGARVAIVLSLCVLSGLLQLVQFFLPGREFNVEPIFYNIAGIIAAVAAGPYVRRTLERLLNSVIRVRFRRNAPNARDMTNLPACSAVGRPTRVAHGLLELCNIFNINLEISVPTSFGGELRGPLLDGNVLYIARDGCIEPGVTNLLMERLKAGNVFVDVGAHIGYFTVLASGLVGPSGRVFAFEPTPRTFGWLTANTAALNNVVLENKAVMNQSGIMGFTTFEDRYCSYNSFFAPRATISSPGRLQNIRTVSLDEYFGDGAVRPNVIKIDAESAELHVLRGMSHMLRSTQLLVILELGDVNGSGAPFRSVDVVNYLESFDYHAFDIANGRLIPHQKLLTYPYCQLAFLPRRVNA